ncbi:SAM-dependent methyltransferase [Actinomadura atramentaria]|uniref:SAM-dependent methyltransferase n=1 Tax=Actinomadura atramentaria TaxID=1990 RepID=UPI00037DB245|nr:SAM-dependent methyltransferase [Actinomadura atramentaria]
MAARDASGGAPAFDTSVAHIARVQDCWLGGKDNFPADRIAAQQAIEAMPDMVASVRNTRAFLARSVRHLAEGEGVRQFLDIGTGIPAANNTHEVAQAVAPESRVVYADNDPIVLAHARALLTSGPQGATAYLDADLRDTAPILEGARRVLDFERPIAVMLVAVLQYIPDEDDPYGIVEELMAAVPSGSYLVVSHPASDIQASAMAGMASRLNELMAQKVRLRDRAGVARFFDGFDLVEPGLVRAPEWRPDRPEDAATPSTMWSGAARKP